MIDKPSLKNLTSPKFKGPPTEQNEFLQSLGTPHLESFNYLLEEGLDHIVKYIVPVEFVHDDHRIKLSFSEICLLPPLVPSNMVGARTQELWPTECRQRRISYSGRIIVKINWEIDGKPQIPLQKEVGCIPVMLKSKVCHLSNLSPEELIEHNEHAEEWGGYFVVKGNEKLIRMLMLTRRNYPVAVKRTSWKQRGYFFSDLGVLIRCVQEDQTSTNNVLHYATDGNIKLMFSYRKSLYYAPLILMIKCLVDVSDESIFKKMMEGFEHNQSMKWSVLKMLRNLHYDGIHTHSDARNFVGKTFRVKFYDLPSFYSNEDICDFLLRRCLLIHLNDYRDKWNCLTLMTQKLFSLAEGECALEGVDSVMSQEILLGGHLYLQVLKERLYYFLLNLKSSIIKRQSGNITHDEISKVLKKLGGIDAAIENFLSTGNLHSSSDLGLMQDKGLVILLENVNRMRYMAHFRATHRGSFFQQMRTTEGRQLLPDAWGFICPVHTPDGTPCGLLNHLSKDCLITPVPDPNLISKLPEILTSLGMQPIDGIGMVAASKCYTTMLDGKIIGRVPQNIAGRVVDKLRIYKIRGEKAPKTLEIAFIKHTEGGQFPGIYLFTGPARMMRPVINLAAKQVELIGTLEQVQLDICIKPEENYKGITTHQEISKTSFLSNLASLIPMPDCNQSPRNMYQCQMGKQTMGTPCHTWHIQSETKLYRLQTPGSPLFRPTHYDKIELDNYAMGTNAIIAVISYTGYDMEDAMIINKASLERGFAHGSIYKTELIELQSSSSYFGLDPTKPFLNATLGEDGLPFPGTKLCENDPYYCYYDHTKSKFVVGEYSNKEEAIVDHVKLCGAFPGTKETIKACILLRIQRNPTVGDKFASRAGQKGICSQQLAAEDLPFTESGLVPDIVFNPHGFPSRMTIAMMLECLAGKSAAILGLVHDATPFEFSEEETASDYFGKLLQECGYNYYGTERMYSGINGCELNASIFFGIVHYQRLRHMVSDKWQVRSTGPVDVLTHQPVKGRRRGGGIRFGEMERDALISHGAAFLLQDRLFHGSDKTLALICRTCGTILGPILIVSSPNDETTNHSIKCRICEKNGRVDKIEVPYIFRYLAVQLASANIKLKLQIDGS
uniref:DNA-directed RNA polymerase subunit beta n=1 Tax=Panstrongylus lignarius TaxID=156445 RepID=A0A224XGY9_9HEMI